MTPGRAESGAAAGTAGTAAVTALAALLLGGCGAVDPDALVPSPPPAKPTVSPAVSPTASVAAQDPAKPSPAFTPLPTPQQVVAALPAGRPDPFAPIPPPPGSAPAKVAGGGTAAAAAPSLLLTGLIHSAGQVQALVQIGAESGPVCVGRRGACPGTGLPPLLPAGWNVTSIDVASGRLALRQAGQRLVLQL